MQANDLLMALFFFLRILDTTFLMCIPGSFVLKYSESFKKHLGFCFVLTALHRLPSHVSVFTFTVFQA